MNYLKRIAFILVCIMCFILGACSVSTVSAEQNHPLKIWAQNKNGDYNTLNIVDSNTGVNYVVVSLYRTGSSAYGGIAITPRLNADGSLYITK